MKTIEVIFIDINKISSEALFNSSFLSDDNVFNLSKYKVEEVKKEKACSLIVKNKYIGEYQLNKYGKPICKSCYFNISHSKGALVFVKDDKEIGIDIEKIRKVDDKLVDYISSKEERKYINNEINFYEIWTSKESLVKAIGTGIGKVKEIPGLPINGIKKYINNEYFIKNIKYNDFIISITRKEIEPFDIKIKEIEEL